MNESTMWQLVAERIFRVKELSIMEYNIHMVCKMNKCEELFEAARDRWQAYTHTSDGLIRMDDVISDSDWSRDTQRECGILNALWMGAEAEDEGK